MNQNQLTVTESKYLRILAKKHILLPTKFKKPLVKNWNKHYAEYRSIEQLLATNQEYSLRTGTPIGNYYFIAIDLDDIWAKERIKTNWFVKTNKGIHRYFFIRELPKSCWLVNKEGQKVGELHSKGRFVVGIGSLHELGIRYTLKGRVNEKWSSKIESLKELQEFLTERNIFATPWGKQGKENIRDLKIYKPSETKFKEIEPKPKKPSQEQKYCQKKKKMAEQIAKHPQKANLNTCYICLVFFAKTPQIIKSHLNGKQHQKNWKIYQAQKTKNFPQNGL